jgi:hypothetical protein
MRLRILFVRLGALTFLLKWRGVVVFFFFVWILFRVVGFMLIFILLFWRINFSSSQLFYLLGQVVNITCIRVFTIRKLSFICFSWFNLFYYLRLLIVWLRCSNCSNHVVRISVWINWYNVFRRNWPALLHLLLMWLYIILNIVFFFSLFLRSHLCCIMINYDISLRFFNQML